MIKGLYQSEQKVYFRDQEYFYHYLYFDGSGGVYNLTGSYDADQALKVMLKSTKSIKGFLNTGPLSTIATVRVLTTGKAPNPDGSNVTEYKLSIKSGNGCITVKNQDARDYKEYSGVYKCM